MSKKADKTRHPFFTSLFSSKKMKLMENNFVLGKNISNVCKKLSNGKLNEEERTALNYLRNFNSVQNDNYTDFLYLLTREIQANSVLELGTQNGSTGQALLKGIADNSKEDTYFLTLGQDPEGCETATKYFEEITHKDNFKVICGDIDYTIDKLIGLNKRFDIICMNDNKKYQPTVDFYNYVKNFTSKKAFIIINGIHNKPEITKAWKHIQALEYSFSVDFFKFGLMAFEPDNKQKQKYKLNLKS